MRAGLSLLEAIGHVYFQGAPATGAAILCCMFLASPAMGLGCVLGGASALLAARMLGGAPAAHGLYACNAVLTGAGLAALYHCTPALLAWIVAGGIATTLATHLFRRCGKLPALTAPFVLWMLLADAAGLARLPAGAAGGLAAPFLAVGQIGFIGHPALGTLVLLALWLENWRHGAWALAAAMLALAPTGQEAGMGVNCVLVVLGLRASGIAWPVRCAAAAGAAMLCLLLGATGAPYFTLPFVMATWLALMACGRGASPPAPRDGSRRCG